MMYPRCVQEHTEPTNGTHRQVHLDKNHPQKPPTSTPEKKTCFTQTRKTRLEIHRHTESTHWPRLAKWLTVSYPSKRRCRFWRQGSWRPSAEVTQPSWFPEWSGSSPPASFNEKIKKATEGREKIEGKIKEACLSYWGGETREGQATVHYLITVWARQQ